MFTRGKSGRNDIAIPGTVNKKLCDPPSRSIGDEDTQRAFNRHDFKTISGLQRKVAKEDYAILVASMRCFLVHTRLSNALEMDIDDGAAIRRLGQERVDAISALATIRAKSFSGIQLKQKITALVVWGYDESVRLIKSCLRDYDALLRIPPQQTLSQAESVLAKRVTEFHIIAKKISKDAEHYDFVDADVLDVEHKSLVDILRSGIVEFEAAVLAVGREQALTYQGLRAKLAVFEMCDMTRGNLAAVLILRQSIYLDLDRLLRWDQSPSRRPRGKLLKPKP